MPRIFPSLLLALLFFRGLAEAEVSYRLMNTVYSNDIRFDEEPAVGAGSGSGKLPFSDDEDLGDLSGSGSGSGQGNIDFEAPEEQTTPKVTLSPIDNTTPTTKMHLSPCERERMHQTSLLTGQNFIPTCEDGVYAPLQCAKIPGESDCWCSDKFGKDIIGTVMEAPNVPDCISGTNLRPCLRQLVTVMRENRLLGSPKPHCTEEGHFYPVQCTGATCYCVDKETGEKDVSTVVHRPAIPRCSDDMDEEKGKDDIDTSFPTDSDDSLESEIDTDDSINLVPDDNETTDIIIPDSEDTDSDETYNIDNVPKNVDNIDNEPVEEDKLDENKIDQGVEDNIKTDRYHDKETKMSAASPIMAQPGLLAGIIGGSVVVALCLVLLIMFIIYRMRKKDEGSYPLDEPRKPPKYPYMRAPEREFYA